MGQAALAQEQEYYTDLPVGEILRRARMHYGHSIADVERDLRIRAVQIDAIEQGDLEQLPARVYAIGFVRSYAEYLGLDSNMIVRLFKEQSIGPQTNPELHFPAAAADSKTPPVWLVVVSLVALVGIISLWNGSHQQVDSLKTVPNAPSLAQNDISKPFGPSRPEDVEPAAAAPARPGMNLIVRESSVIEIMDDQGSTILSKALEPGDEYFVPDRAGYIMSLSNLAGVDLQIDGRNLELSAQAFSSGIPLDSLALKTVVKPAGAQ